MSRALRTWIEINESAVQHNIKVFRGLIPKETKLMAVVKSNAYGHNIHEFSKLAVEAGVDMLGVDSITEAVPLRKAGIRTPILVLGFTMPETYALAAEHDVAITISSVEQLLSLLSTNLKHIHIHLKVDTGMCRQGFQFDDERGVVSRLLLRGMAVNTLILDGLYTHLASAKVPGKGNVTERQLFEFNRWKMYFNESGIPVQLAHAAASAGTILYPEAHLDMVRIGMGCYGHYPSSAIERHTKRKLLLRPALSWHTIVSEVKGVRKGAVVGYDGTYGLKRNSIIAVIPVGYWHGIGRVISNNGRVLVHGEYAPIIGRVSMDMITLDVTDIPGVVMGTQVTLIGREGESVITAEEIAEHSNTTAYEVLTRLNSRIERRVT